MKTTIELPDGLARRTKEIAREQGVSMREVIEAGLRAELDRRTRPQPASAFRFHTVGGRGLRPDVDPAELRERAYES